MIQTIGRALIEGFLGFLGAFVIFLAFQGMRRIREDIKPKPKKQSLPPFKTTDEAMNKIIDSLDGTGGYIIKSNELKYWIDHFVNEDRKKR